MYAELFSGLASRSPHWHMKKVFEEKYDELVLRPRKSLSKALCENHLLPLYRGWQAKWGGRSMPNGKVADLSKLRAWSRNHRRPQVARNG